MTVHQCAIDGCGYKIGLGLLMCRHHWYMVPVDIRREISINWSVLRRRIGNQAEASIRYHDAVEAAKAAVAERETKSA